ncbi:MAG: class B sortase [Ruminococcus sp.]|nr:class B sortase [Ruminococcus sp.]
MPEKLNNKETTSKKTKDTQNLEKISEIRASLYKIAEEEDDEQMVSRIATNVKFLKAKKEFPEWFERSAYPAGRVQKNNLNSSVKAVKNYRGYKKKKGVLRNLFPCHGDGIGEVLRKSIFWLSIAIFLVCLVLIIKYFVELQQSKNVYESVGSDYHSAFGTTDDSNNNENIGGTSVSLESDDTIQTTVTEIYNVLPGAQSLLDLNSDVAGYILIPDTVVDYPLMQYKDDVPGKEYYLYKDFYKNDSQPGSIFLDYRCDFDVVGNDKTLAAPNSDNLIVYGHDMRDGSMFGSLHSYKDDNSYYDNHPIIYLNSNYKSYQFKIFGYFIADAEDSTDTRFEYWNAINFSDEEKFYNYVNEVKRRTLRLTNVDVKYGDQLLTLSTCNSTFNTARLVICARMVREGEDVYSGTTGSIPNPNIKWPNVYYAWNEKTYDPNAEFIPYG